MKKAFFTVTGLLCFTMIIMGADIRIPRMSVNVEPKKHCVGYTIIEANKGINCKGDTVALVRRHGYYELKPSE